MARHAASGGRDWRTLAAWAVLAAWLLFVLLIALGAP